MAYFIKSVADENGNYGNPHSPAHEGDVELPDSLLMAYLDTKGFAVLTVDNGVITAITLNAEAYNAYETEHPPVPPVPSQLDRIEAQALYTALMTDTLLED